MKPFEWQRYEHALRIATLPRSGSVRVSNESYIAEMQSKFAALSRTATLSNEFNLTSGGTMFIPYGDHPHWSGDVQRFTRAAANAIVNNFHAFKAQAATMFAGLPVFKGHPDDHEWAALPENQPVDGNSYAWIMDMRANDRGLELIPKWSNPGIGIIKEALVKFFSPRWQVKQIGNIGEKSIVEPFRLVSVGLTNKPQIAVPPLANQGVP